MRGDQPSTRRGQRPAGWSEADDHLLIREALSHTPAILAANFEERLRNLPQRTDLYGFHEFGKDVLTPASALLQAL